MILRLAPIFLAALLIYSAAALFISCDDDEPATNASANADLQGDWDATSFIVSGVETIGTVNSGLTMSFTSQSDESGSFQGTIFDLDQNSNTTVFTYDVLDDGSRIRLGPDTLDMILSGNNLNLNGVLFGFPSVVVANQ